jgi:molybdopterin synthase sulfur carrier subunit
MKLVYFAWVREKIGTSGEDVNPPPTVETVAQLIDWLLLQGDNYRTAFDDMKIIRVAVNQQYVALDSPVRSGDEVAFFPPVTGG